MQQDRTTRLAIIQPVLAPYRRPLFELIAQDPSVALKVFVLSESMPYRRSWGISGTEKFDLEVVSGLDRSSRQKVSCKNANFSVDGVGTWSPRLSKAVGKFRPDVVLCTNISEFVTLLPLKLSRRCRIGAWVEDTEYTSIHYYSPSKRWLRKRIYRLMDFHLYNGIDTKNFLINVGIGTGNIFPAWCSVDNSLYSASASVRLPIEGRRARWITVGSLIYLKGIGQLIQAWNSQPDTFHEHNELNIVGEGPDLDELTSLSRASGHDNIHFTGFMTPENLAIMYGESDVFVFPTLLDIWGLVVNEAMASGLPILCSRYAGCASDLVTSKNGRIIDPLDEKSLAQSLHDFWKIRENWPSMGNASRDIVANYNLAVTADTIITAAKRNTRR